MSGAWQLVSEDLTERGGMFACCLFPVPCLKVRIAAGAELSSGNHSHNCQEAADSSDDREVASALKSGGLST